MNTYRIDLANFKQGVDFHEIAQSAKGTFDILIDRVDSQIKRLMPSQNLFNTTPKPNSKYNERG